MRLLSRTFVSTIVIAASTLGAGVPTGPAVGETVPRFSAADQNGRTRTLESLTGRKGLVLVFFRSADW